jgi:hypothetical protein
LQLDETLSRRVEAWLVTHCAIDLTTPLPGSNRLATPRATDRMRWAAYRALRRGAALSDDFMTRAKMRVDTALRDDLRFWEKWDAAGTE